MPIKTSLMHSSNRGNTYCRKAGFKAFFTLFLSNFSPAIYAKYPVFGSASFSEALLAAALILALILWRKTPEASIIIISMVASLIFKSFYPIIPALACIIYLIHREIKQVFRQKSEQPEPILQESATETKSYEPHIASDLKYENLKHEWIRLNETDFLELINPAKIHSLKHIRIVVQPIATGILFKRPGSQEEVFIPEDAIKDFWKY